jgi:hypothetical protein
MDFFGTPKDKIQWFDGAWANALAELEKYVMQKGDRGKDLYLWAFFLVPIDKILSLDGGFVWPT